MAKIELFGEEVEIFPLDYCPDCERLTAEVARLKEEKAELLGLLEEMARALEAVLEMPIAGKELEYLHRGIGTQSESAAWLKAEQALQKHRER